MTANDLKRTFDIKLFGVPIDITDSLPDVIRYYFDCEKCGNVFGMLVEAYHGQGGKWSKL